MPEELTGLERRILEYLVRYLRHNTYQPSIREIGREFGVPSTKTVAEHLQALAEKGWIERDRSRNRGVRIIGLDISVRPRDPLRRQIEPGQADEPFPGAGIGDRSGQDARSVSRWAEPGTKRRGAEFAPVLDEDPAWMQRALEQAIAGESLEEVPIGAVVVLDDRLIAEGHNRNRSRRDPAGHAEIVALRRAARRLGEARLNDATMYVTLEPCAMCAGAIVLARIKRLVFAAEDPKSGMCGSLACIVQDERLNHRVEITRNVLAEEAGNLLREFFRLRRADRR